MVGISSFVCHIGWYISQCVVCEQYWLVYQPVLSVGDNNGWFITKIDLSWTILVIISPSFVCRGQEWLVYHPCLSVLDNFDVYMTRFCLSWTILVGKSPGFVCYGQLWLV